MAVEQLNNKIDLQAKNNFSSADRAEEQAEIVKYTMDFRPVGDQGNSVGAEARQRARIKQLEKVGRGILMDEAIFTDIAMISHTNGGILFELVKPGKPIPEAEMIPNSQVNLTGVFTPFEPTGKSLFLKLNRSE